MKLKRILTLTLALLLAPGLAACGDSDENAATVQSVSMLMGVDLSGSGQYGGIVVAKDTVKVMQDSEKTVKECCVSVGDTVQAGDVLFTYDTDALELKISTAELEAEQLQNSITSYESQITELEKERSSADSPDKLSYTIQIQETELNKSEAEYNLKQKQAEVEKLKASVGETEVRATVSGVVQTVNGSSSDSTDGSYITIQETGDYRIKCTASEEVVQTLYAGMPVTAVSRTDSSQTWSGSIDSVNTDSAEESEASDNADGESSTKYAFYVTLDSSDGLLIGQHVYLRVGEAASAGTDGIRLTSGYVVQDGNGNASVWADNGSGKLEKRTVTLGAYDEELDEYEITDGLALTDYIAYPDDTLTEGMSTVKYDESSFTGDEVPADDDPDDSADDSSDSDSGEDYDGDGIPDSEDNDVAENVVIGGADDAEG